MFGVEEVNSKEAKPSSSLFVDDCRNRFTKSGGYRNTHCLQLGECGLLNLQFFHALVAMVEAYDNLVCR